MSRADGLTCAWRTATGDVAKCGHTLYIQPTHKCIQINKLCSMHEALLIAFHRLSREK